tara:strand:+ start:642 stop:1301 length:660 start_codon:yes stop_codon:yes gene_type:complete
MKNVAIILAGGSGSRFGGTIPKQFQLLNERRIIDYSIKEFENHDLINEIIIVCHKNWLSTMKNEYNRHQIIRGGSTRQKSSLEGLNACDKNTDNVLIHDAARPFITNVIISDCIKLLSKYDAINISIPATDTIVINNNNFIKSIPNRDDLLISQTPQAFKFNTIFKAHNNFKGDNLSDDIQLVNNMNIKCYNHKGSRNNIKITNKLDLDLAKVIINKTN